MPTEELSVIDYDTTSRGSHRWLLSAPPFAPPGPESRYAVYFGDTVGRFDCSCAPITLQAQEICDHKIFVAQHITRKSGPWERDRILMDYAWELLKTFKKEPEEIEFDGDKRNLVFRYEGQLYKGIDKAMEEAARQIYAASWWTVDFSTMPDETVIGKFVRKTEDGDVLISLDPEEKPTNPTDEPPKKPRGRFQDLDL